MVHITRGQEVRYTPMLVVISPTDDYNEGDLIDCGLLSDDQKKMVSDSVAGSFLSAIIPDKYLPPDSYCAFCAEDIARMI
jgi:hypothetical protein